MKHFSFSALCLAIASILSACGAGGAPATPALDALDLQGTIAAAAFTVVAETQAAIPTATPVTPTATVLPTSTATVPPLPPLAGTFTPVPNGSSGSGDPCINKTLPDTLQGEPVRIRLNNSTKAKISVTVYLDQNGPQGVCGYRSYTIDPQQFLVLNNLVEGCFTIWAWNPDPDEYFIATNGTNCLNNTDTWVFDISTSSIRLGP